MNTSTASNVVLEKLSAVCGHATPIQFQSAEQFRNRPGFITRLTCTTDELDRIIGKYEFDAHRVVRCGLNQCNTEHWHGYVIRTKDGRETNIGQHCGKREFGVAFEQVEAVYRAAEERDARTRSIRSLIDNKIEILNQAHALQLSCSSLAKEVSDILNLIQREVPLDKAFRDAVRLQGSIKGFRKATEAERMAMGKDGRKEHAEIAVNVGTIRGTSCLESVYAINNIMKFKVFVPLHGLNEEALNDLPDGKLKELSDEIKMVRQTLREVEAFCEAAKAFCAPTNRRVMSRLIEVIPDKHRKDRTVRLMKQLAQA